MSKPYKEIPCALCGDMTRVNRRGTFSHKRGHSIYLCHGVTNHQDCYSKVSRNPELKAGLTGKEMIPQK